MSILIRHPNRDELMRKFFFKLYQPATDLVRSHLRSIIRANNQSMFCGDFFCDDGLGQSVTQISGLTAKPNVNANNFSGKDINECQNKKESPFTLDIAIF